MNLSELSQDAVDDVFMAEALRLARKGVFTTQPNPRVGCVLVKDNKVVGRGWHKKAGEPHAEVHALRQAGDMAKGTCAYVTLEPCSHFGMTPPCADALIHAGVARVVAAIEDPNPQVAGKGLALLRAGGIEVKVNVLSDEARILNKGFIKRMGAGLPWVSIKMAMSLDGRTAMASGESQWITGSQARADVQRLRAESSAVITGIGTLLQDDAALTVRAEQFDVKRFVGNVCIAAEAGFDGVSLDEIIQNQPLRVVMDSKARMPIDSRLLSLESPVLWVVAETLELDSNQSSIADLPFVEVLSLPELSSSESVKFVLEHLALLGCNEILVEAGSNLAGSFVEAGLWDELIVYMAPKLLGSSAKPLLNLPIDKMLDTKLLILKDIRHFGEDIRLTYQSASFNGEELSDKLQKV
jgi:diaminohydroxyphosphoribosylaminopyrimidine deaminase/5-amino-6-(5-phosphoribosylamino)uracil reductase